MDILITGSIAFDYLMRFPGRFKEAIVLDALDKVSLSFLVDEMTRHFGGVAANIAYSVALLGGNPRLMGTAGRDFGDYKQWLDSVGVDTSTTVVLDDIFTASFFATTDLDNNQMASFHAGAMGRAGQYGIFDVTDKTPDLVVVSPNAPEAMNRIVDECKRHQIPYLYDPSQQTARIEGDVLRHGIHQAKILAVNEYEWELITQKTGLSRDEILKEGTSLIVTRGKDGADIFSDDRYYHIPTVPAVQVIDPTGGGDAFRAGLLRGLQHGWSWELSGRLGAIMATYAIEVTGTQNHRFTPSEFVARFRQYFDDNGLLDSLVTADNAKESQHVSDRNNHQ